MKEERARAETRAVSTIYPGRAGSGTVAIRACQKKVFQDPDTQRYKSKVLSFPHNISSASRTEHCTEKE